VLGKWTKSHEPTRVLRDANNTLDSARSYSTLTPAVYAREQRTFGAGRCEPRDQCIPILKCRQIVDSLVDLFRADDRLLGSYYLFDNAELAYAVWRNQYRRNLSRSRRLWFHPIRSLTALRKRCLQPKYRSVVCTDTSPSCFQMLPASSEQCVRIAQPSPIPNSQPPSP
jgi:hypothetical protein